MARIIAEADRTFVAVKDDGTAYVRAVVMLEPGPGENLDVGGPRPALEHASVSFFANEAEAMAYFREICPEPAR